MGLLSGLFSCDNDPEVVPSGEADIVSFTLAEETGSAMIDCSGAAVHSEVGYGTVLSDLSPTITFSPGVVLPPNFKLPSDYTTPVTITVEAEDGSVKNWTINVTEEPPPPSDDTDILAYFILPEQTSLATIDNTNHTVDIEVVNGANLTDLTPRFSLSIGAYSVPESGTNGDYSNAVTIRVLAEDEIAYQDWTVNVIEAPVGISSETDILTFSAPDQSFAPYIDPNNHKISYHVDDGTDLANFTPTFSLSPGATSVPVSGTTGDYTSLVTITVTAEDGTTTQDWIVDAYLAEDFDASIFCNENLCTNDDALQQECQEFLISCLLTQDGRNYDECLITALSICRF